MLELKDLKEEHRTIEEIHAEKKRKEQIETKKEELARMIRLYILGLTKAYMVKNTLNCLFVDVLLDMSAKKQDFQKGNFNQLLKEMNE